MATKKSYRYTVVYRLPSGRREATVTIDAKTLATLKKQGRLVRILSRKEV